MGDERLASAPVGFVPARIVEAGLLLHRQAVELGADHDGGPVAIFVDGDQPGYPDLLGHVEAERTHLAGEPRGGIHFLEREFRMGVQLLVERVEFWVIVRDRGLDRFLEPDSVEFGVGRQQGCREQGGGRYEGFDAWMHGTVP